MNTIICENCEEENEFGLKYCKKCGHQLYYSEEFGYVEKKDNENEVFGDNEKMGMDINLSVNEAVSIIIAAGFGMDFSKRIIKFSQEEKCVVLVGKKWRLKRYEYATIIVNSVGTNTNIDMFCERRLKEQIIKLFEDYRA